MKATKKDYITTIKVWEELANGLISDKEYSKYFDEIKYLKNGCAFCEDYYTYFLGEEFPLYTKGCLKCPLYKDNICGSHTSVIEKWTCTIGKPELEKKYAKKIYSAIKKVCIEGGIIK